MNQICQQMEEIERLKAEAAEKEAKMQERIAYLERVSYWRVKTCRSQATSEGT